MARSISRSIARNWVLPNLKICCRMFVNPAQVRRAHCGQKIKANLLRQPQLELNYQLECQRRLADGSKIRRTHFLGCHKFALFSAISRPTGDTGDRYFHQFHIAAATRGLSTFVDGIGSREQLNNTTTVKGHGIRQELDPFDLIEVEVHGGAGGNGCASFLRDFRISRGPPNGGNGGRGGHVLVAATSNLHTLENIPRKVVATRGGHGRGSQQNGAKGEDTILYVPIGTVIREVDVDSQQSYRSTDISEEFNQNDSENFAHEFAESDRLENEQQTADRRKSRVLGTTFEERARRASKKRGADAIKWLNHPSIGRRREVQSSEWSEANSIAKRLRYYGSNDASNYFNRFGPSEPSTEPMLLCHGGQGGFGNSMFLSTRNKNPHYATAGRKGESRKFVFELKTLCDVGLVGLPNAGKSTFLKAISKAQPLIDSYAFTTLSPNLGIVRIPRVHANHDDLVFKVADIPGVIENASRGKGLGLAFLRHIERARVLAFVIDVGTEDSDPVSTFHLLRDELQRYNPEILQKPSLVLANKCDLEKSKEHFEALKLAVQVVNPQMEVAPLSAMLHQGHKRACALMAKVLLKSKAIERKRQSDDLNESMFESEFI